MASSPEATTESKDRSQQRTWLSVLALIVIGVWSLVAEMRSTAPATLGSVWNDVKVAEGGTSGLAQDERRPFIDRIDAKVPDDGILAIYSPIALQIKDHSVPAFFHLVCARLFPRRVLLMMEQPPQITDYRPQDVGRMFLLESKASPLAGPRDHLVEVASMGQFVLYGLRAHQ